MHPTTSEIVESLIWSLQTYIEPEIRSPFARSVMLTVENLLRHVELRADYEAELLFNDSRDLESVLRHSLDRLQSHSRLWNAFSNRIRGANQVVEDAALDSREFPSVTRLRRRSIALRALLDELLQALGEVRYTFRDDPVYVDVRREMRAYMARYLERTEDIIKPAFIGGRR